MQSVESNLFLSRDLEQTRLLQWTPVLALIAISHDTEESMVSVFFGMKDKTIALLGGGRTMKWTLP